MRKKRDEWLCGYAAAVATGWFVLHDDQRVEAILKEDGVTIAQIRRAGVGPFELGVIEGALKRRKAVRCG